MSALVGASTATAANVDFPPTYNGEGTEANNVTVSHDSTTSEIVFTDASNPTITDNSGAICTVSGNQARCAHFFVFSPTVNGNDGDDTVVFTNIPLFFSE